MTTQVSERLFDILRVLRDSNAAGARLQDIVLQAGLPRPSAHRLLADLVRLDVVERADGKRYRLGRGLHALGGEAPAPDYESPDIRAIVQQVAHQSGDTIALAMRVFGGIRFLLRCDGHFPVRTRVDVGEMRAFYSSYAGIALMSQLDDRAIATLLEAPGFEANELWAGHDPVIMRREILGCIEHTRQNGWFSSVGVIAGVAGMAALVPAKGHDAHLALVISAVEPRLSRQRAIDLAPMLLDASDRLGAAIASRPSR